MSSSSAIRVLLLLAIHVIFCVNAIYRGHKIVRLYPDIPDDIHHLHVITKRSNQQIRFWDDEEPQSISGSLPRHVDMVTSQNGYNTLLDSLAGLRLEYDVLSHDVQGDVNKHRYDNEVARMDSEYFKSYHTLDEIISFLNKLASRCGGRCSVFELGRSYIGRPLTAIKISGGSGGPKPKVWIGAGIHAREWISHATAQYLAQSLVDDYDSDPAVRQLVDNYEWHILPCINPDGYNFTWDTDRLWRKTRSTNQGTFCVGTDANRNFDFRWGEVGTSTDPCTNNFQGPFPFSEPETAAISNHIMTNNGSWALFLSLHSKGQLIMSPWGFTTELPEDYSDLERVGVAMERAIYATHGMTYRFGPAAAILYKSAGTSRDWARGAAHIKYVYTIELRDQGQKGWLLPPDQIIPTGQEVWAALRAGMAEIRG